MQQIKTIQASVIETAGLQIRAEMSREHVDELVELFDSDNPTWPTELPPVVVFCNGKKYWLADGHHRLAAAKAAGCMEIRVDVRRGEKDDALRYALGANADHGLRRTNQDKRNAVRIAFLLYPNEPGRAIARMCRVGHDMANYVLRDLRHPKEELSESDNSSQEGGKKTPASEVDDGVGNSTGESGRGETAEKLVAEPPAGLPPAPRSPEKSGGREVDGDRSEYPRHTAASPPSFVLVDCLGVPCQSDSAARAFASLECFDQLDRLLSQAAKLIDHLGSMAGAELYRVNHLKIKKTMRGGVENESAHSPDLANAQAELRHWRPYSLCPCCRETPQHDCKVCLGLPYATQTAFERCSEKIRASVLALKGGASRPLAS